MNIYEQIKQAKIIAIVRGIEQHSIIDTCKALYAGGITMIEVTFDQSSPTGNDDAYKAIKAISDELGGDICAGAGTVMTEEQLYLAKRAGAKYIISPHFDQALVKKTVDLGLAAIPGVMTPSEIVQAYAAGATAAKIFPISRLGGPAYLKDVRAPISHIPMLAVGGVDIDNIRAYLDAGALGVGLGSSLIDKTLIAQEQYGQLTDLARKFVALTK